MRKRSEYPFQQPNSDFCFVCGRNNPNGLYVTFFDNGRDEVFAEKIIPETYQGYPGVVHGGVVAALLDEIVARVSMIGDPHHFMMSVKLEVKYRQPVPTETPLIALARIVKLRGRLGKAVGEIILPNGQIAAESVMTLADVPTELLGEMDTEALGWRVDPGR